MGLTRFLGTWMAMSTTDLEANGILLTGLIGG